MKRLMYALLYAIGLALMVASALCLILLIAGMFYMSCLRFGFVQAGVVPIFCLVACIGGRELSQWARIKFSKK